MTPDAMICWNTRVYDEDATRISEYLRSVGKTLDDMPCANCPIVNKVRVASVRWYWCHSPFHEYNLGGCVEPFSLYAYGRYIRGESLADPLTDGVS